MKEAMHSQLSVKRVGWNEDRERMSSVKGKHENKENVERLRRSERRIIISE
jgi:hypothetical protein